ncbi:glycerophosphodiester phosphodiesterase [Seonamhaeicola algicola]|uniref:Glycerophosphodiester phosphodiesterase n=1 Tax=Seonamhaeicola algicola TaxID=1719036 RepID=A0A5C7ADV7_9FLAO|nr:glycerophosphodiester phosphodiesterase family protein [Seonamhaeicola algicola]TXE06094.1 glycerophosphodiester phosphodiesterase [Seonamhaeicola algicola]
MKILNYIVVFLVVFACKEQQENVSKMKIDQGKKVEVQGHRGERGHSPENTIIGFKNAILKGVDVIELDVVISKDKKVVVSHEPYMSSLYVLTPQGDSISKAEEKQYNLYQMPYDSIKTFEVGLKGNIKFPEQKRIKAYKPLLSEVIDSIEAFVSAHKLTPVGYNIEIKSVPSQYEVYQPQPGVMVDLVMQVLNTKTIAGKWNIQSFDPAILNEMHEKYPDVTLAYLVSKGDFKENLKLLNFTPHIYSPNYKLIKTKTVVDTIKAKNMKLIPWTVNDSIAISEQIHFGVDGIITDYPERVLIYNNL